MVINLCDFAFNPATSLLLQFFIDTFNNKKLFIVYIKL